MMTRKALDRLGSTARRRAKYVGEGSPHPVPTAPDVADDVQPAEIVSIPDAHRSGTLTPTEDPVFVQPAVFDTPTAP